MTRDTVLLVHDRWRALAGDHACPAGPEALDLLAGGARLHDKVLANSIGNLVHRTACLAAHTPHAPTPVFLRRVSRYEAALQDLDVARAAALVRDYAVKDNRLFPQESQDRTPERIRDAQERAVALLVLVFPFAPGHACHGLEAFVGPDEATEPTFQRLYGALWHGDGLLTSGRAVTRGSPMFPRGRVS